MNKETRTYFEIAQKYAHRLQEMHGDTVFINKAELRYLCAGVRKVRGEYMPKQFEEHAQKLSEILDRCTYAIVRAGHQVELMRDDLKYLLVSAIAIGKVLGVIPEDEDEEGGGE